MAAVDGIELFYGVYVEFAVVHWRVLTNPESVVMLEDVVLEDVEVYGGWEVLRFSNIAVHKADFVRFIGEIVAECGFACVFWANHHDGILDWQLSYYWWPRLFALLYLDV